LETKYKSSHKPPFLGGGKIPDNLRLIVLVGAGQNWSSYDQYKPESQPPHTVIHVVDPLDPYRNMVGDYTDPDQVQHDLVTMNPLNSYYQIPFDLYLQDIVYSEIDNDHFAKIIIVSYTEMVSLEIVDFYRKIAYLYIVDMVVQDFLRKNWFTYLYQINRACLFLI